MYVGVCFCGSLRNHAVIAIVINVLTEIQVHNRKKWLGVANAGTRSGWREKGSKITNKRGLINKLIKLKIVWKIIDLTSLCEFLRKIAYLFQA